LLPPAAGEFPTSLLLADELFTGFCWFWLAAEEADELLLLGGVGFGAELSLAERRGAGGSCGGGSRFEVSGGRLLPTREAKLLASSEESGRAALGGALG